MYNKKDEMATPKKKVTSNTAKNNSDGTEQENCKLFFLLIAMQEYISYVATKIMKGKSKSNSKYR